MNQSFSLLFLLAGSLAAQTPASNLHIQILSGEGAVNYAKSRTNREIIVQVQDENNRPVGGATVTFLLPERGAGGTFANGSNFTTVTTNAKGEALVHGIKPNNIAGNFQVRVTASFRGQTATASVSQTNAAAAASAGAAAGAGISAKVIAIVVAVGAAGAAGGVIAATRGGSSPAPAPTPPVPVSAGSASFGPPGH